MPTEKLGVVFIPGIMGSCLRTKAGKTPVWEENMYSNYRRLSDEIDLLDFTTELEASAILEVARFWKYPMLRMYDKILHQLSTSKHYTLKPKVFAGYYDWRMSNVDSARDLAVRLSTELGQDLKKPLKDVRLRFITHSMGGLVIRLALLKRFIHPRNVRDIFHIAPPLLGSPAAFKSLLREDALPFLSPFIRLLTDYSDSHIAARQLLDVLAKFPSTYELMPYPAYQFVQIVQSAGVGPTMMINPLYEAGVSPPLIQKLAEGAQKVRALLSGFDAKFGAQIPVHVIYCNDHASERTALHFAVSKTAAGYGLQDPIPLWDCKEGDGSVPAWSAENGEPATLKLHRIPALTHNVMCGKNAVLDRLAALGAI